MNIFVGSLNYQTTAQDLEKLFSEFGAVSSAKVINDNYTNRSRGFGFVEMPDNAAATKAIEQLNGTSFMQQTIVVNEARPKSPSFGGGNRDRDSFSRERGGFKKRF